MTGATWLDEYNTATEVSVASDPTNGPLIAVVAGDNDYAKEGSMTGATWTQESSAYRVVAVASDAKNGPVIGLAGAAV